MTAQKQRQFDRNVARICLLIVIATFFIDGGFGGINRQSIFAILLFVPRYIYLLVVPFALIVAYRVLRYLAFVIGIED